MTDLTKEDVDALKSTIQRLQKENFDLRRKVAYKKTSSISSKLALKNNLKKYLPPAAHKFVGHQIDFSTKRHKGIRWPDDLKTFALQLKGISTRAYVYVKKIFKLPAIRTLHQTLNALHIKEGFHEPVLKALEQQTTVLSDADKIVVVAYDEMSLKQQLYYNRSEDRIEGIKPNTNNSTSLDMNIINHASVFMVRSITGKWKQPIGYFETAGTMTPIMISEKIVESVSLLQNVGLKPVAFVCDQGANNRSAMKYLCVGVDKPWFSVNSQQICSFYDSPHLLKNIRNNFKRHGFQHGNLKFLWEHLVQLFDYDSSRQIRMVPRLTQKHINLPIFSTMSVPLAAQVLSHSVAAAMLSLAELGVLPKEAKATSEFINRFDRLFDCFNSSSLSSTKPLKSALSSSTCHIPFLLETKEWLSGLSPLSKQPLPCLDGWKQNINAILALWNCSIVSPLNFLMTRRINQDCLEHFFGSIRGKGGNRDNPDSHHFRLSYRQSLLDHLIVIGKNANCEEEDTHLLIKLSKLYSVPQPLSNQLTDATNPVIHVQPPAICLPSASINTDILEISLDPLLEEPEENVAAYIAGYLIRRANDKFNCSNCMNLWKANSNEFQDKIYDFIKNKQYDITKEGLITPSYMIFSFVMKLETVFRDHFDSVNKFCNVSQNIISKFQEIIPDVVVCSDQCKASQYFLYSLFARLRINHHVKEYKYKSKQNKTKRNRKYLKVSHT